MNVEKRRIAWRILEFAARIAQEDERAALPLLSAASTAFREVPTATWGQGQVDVNDLQNGLRATLDYEANLARTYPAKEG